GQCAHLRLAAAIEPELLRTRVNDLLPPDIHLLDVQRAPAGFHARHSAVSRSYLYQVSRRRTALAKRFVWWVKRPLDAAAMRAAAANVVGRHDFRLFCERPNEQPSTLVVVEGVEVIEAGSLILVRLAASHFLWKMVRRVVGALVRVGAGELDRRELADLIDGRAGRGRDLPAAWTAPPSGLFLERVIYPGDPPLAPVTPAVPVG